MTLDEALQQIPTDPYTIWIVWRFEPLRQSRLVGVRIVDPNTSRHYYASVVDKGDLASDASRQRIVDALLAHLRFPITHQTESTYANWEAGTKQDLADRLAVFAEGVGL